VRKYVDINDIKVRTHHMSSFILHSEHNPRPVTSLVHKQYVFILFHIEFPDVAVCTNKGLFNLERLGSWSRETTSQGLL
jgi:hypothetical protein